MLPRHLHERACHCVQTSVEAAVPAPYVPTSVQRDARRVSSLPCAREEQSAQDSGAPQLGHRSGCMYAQEHMDVDTWSPATLGRGYPPALAVAQTQAHHLSPQPPAPASHGLAGGQALLWAVFPALRGASQ